MRAAILALALCGACTPDIVAGAYLCGPEQSCPDGQVCNGPDNICVLPGAALPFECGDKITEVEPNNASTAAQPIPNLACVSPLVQVKGCTPTSDTEDWFVFDVPAQCTATEATIRLSFPLAFEQLSLGLDGTATGTVAACGVNLAPDDGTDVLCLEQAVTAGSKHAVRVARSGVGNCGGECGFNRYTLSLQLGTP
ncbi:MAG: hypothetical protein H0T46_20670 [Deltaproteobacteria bacterium]|nr:hypothetical protein [Deltaproteobacteria bacterium]